jgi:predicted RNase H-like nuclease
VVSGPRRGHGPNLPYRLLAGVEPCPGGWLVVIGKLLGINLLPEQAIVLPAFIEVLDYRPSFDVVALHAPIGLPAKPSSTGRRCDEEARTVLGWPRMGAIVSPPARATLASETYEGAREVNGGALSVVQWEMLPKFREVDAVIGPYHQRTVFEVHPELGFHQMNDDRSLSEPKHSESGIAERRGILLHRMPGCERVLDEVPVGASVEVVLDAAANLWTARRIIARAVHRLPEDPEWDETGLRMELLR